MSSSSFQHKQQLITYNYKKRGEKKKKLKYKKKNSKSTKYITGKVQNVPIKKWKRIYHIQMAWGMIFYCWSKHDSLIRSTNVLSCFMKQKQNIIKKKEERNKKETKWNKTWKVIIKLYIGLCVDRSI